MVGRIAAIKRHNPDSPELPRLEAELATESLAEHIARVVDAAPPLTPDQLGRLALLLRPVDGDGADAA